ncbi:MAG: hypothetical protein M0Z30_20350 [Actinomycetota bacterium]|nr:hypothetical protein [Actinomycetota bacterium]
MAVKLAADVGDRRRADCPIRKSFARRESTDAPLPLLAQLVGARAGRAGEPRLKLYLTTLFLAREGTDWHVDGVPAATWATLCGLDSPEGAGAVRINAAIGALVDLKAMEADRRQGREPRLRVRREDLQGPWTSPVGVAGTAHAAENLYAQLDRGFWANGWITVLSARAVAALLILLDATWERDADKEPETTGADGASGPYRRTVALRWWHLPEDQLIANYGVSRDLFDRGIKELIAWRLVEQRPRRIADRSSWGERRWYRELRVRLEVLRTPAAEIEAGREVGRVGHSSEAVALSLRWPMGDE